MLAVPILRIWFCESSRSAISLLMRCPALRTSGISATLFLSPPISLKRQTTAAMCLSRKTRPAPPLLVAAIKSSEHLADQMRIFLLKGIRLDRDLAIIAINEDDHIFGRLS